ncbi:MarR family winged helix-turn-helix transcriptional regulator [Lactobacillus nasalidis]|uniref:MarR family winged helix-turn-helix transcriptional regulator n=1 Tax=Lactobacillus nasalidis TaxID=2797258 RepID=UPI001916746F|nr:MarR family transcriptional regulator [Lactobacillus nasalidis]
MTTKTRALDLFPGQPKVLQVLLEHDGEKARDIGRQCVMDKSTMTGLLKKMEARGLITRRVSNEDKRVVNIFLTEKGREKAKQVNAIGAKIDEQALSVLSDEEKEILFRLLNKVLDNMEENFE